MKNFLSRLAWAAVAVCLAPSASAQSRPLEVGDITTLEAFGRGSISPDGRWAVYEKRGAYDTAPSFDFAQRSPWAIMDLWRIDLLRPAAAPEKLLPDDGPGLQRGEWSPSGNRLLIFRFSDGRYEAGVASAVDRSATWTGLTPDIPLMGPTARWISDTRFLLLTVADGRLPALMRYFAESQTRTTEAWARKTLGRETSRTVVDARDGVATTEAPEPNQALLLLDVKTGLRRTVAEGRILDFEVSPDMRKIAVVLGREPTAIEPGAILQADNARRQRIVLVDLATGASASPAPSWDVAPYLLRWSPDSSAVLVWARRDGADWPNGELVRIDGSGADVIGRGDLSVGSGAEIVRGVHADWLGDTPILFARSPNASRADWHALRAGRAPKILTEGLPSPPASLATVDEAEAYLFADRAYWALTSDGARRVSGSDPLVAAIAIDPERPNRLRINEARRDGWSAALDPEGRSLILDRDGVARRLGLEGHGSLRTLATSPTAALVLDRDQLVETLRLRTADGEFTIDRVNAGLADVALARSTSLEHRDALGRETQSRLFLPDGRRPSEIRALIVKVYPGTVETGAWAGPLGLTYGTRSEVLVGQGYAVLSPSMPIDAPGTNTADFYALSVDLAIDAAFAAHPDLPRDRTVIIGHSFGGYAALAIATRSDRYRAYIATSAVTDMFGEWGEFDPGTRILPEDFIQMRNQQGWVEVGQGERGGPPWSDPEGYRDFSPYLAADRITAPVLLITADRDYIPMSQSERMFSALYRLGGRARLVTYWGEHHAAWSPANIRDRYAQILAWLDETLTATPSARAARPTPGPSPRMPPPP